MSSDLSKNTPEDLIKMRRFLMIAGLVVKESELDDVNEWINLIDELLKDTDKPKSNSLFDSHFKNSKLG